MTIIPLPLILARLAFLLLVVGLNVASMPVLAAAETFPTKQPMDIGGVSSIFIGRTDSKFAIRDLVRTGPVKIAIYLPQGVQRYRGIFFAQVDAASQMIQAPADVWQFVEVQYHYDWLESAVKDGSFLRWVDALADKIGHPELKHAPFAMQFRQFSRGTISPFFASIAPRVIAGGYTFGDDGAVVDFAAAGIPATTPLEGRDGHENAIASLNYKPGRPLTGAVEWGFSHGMWTKIEYNIMFLHQAVVARLPASEGEIGRPVALRPMDVAAGWLGDISEPGAAWREVAPIATYTGDKTKATWLPNAEFAYAWRGYMTQKPPVTITEPNVPYGYKGTNGWDYSISPGRISVSFSPSVPTGAKFTDQRAPVPSEVEAVKEVAIHLGERVLATAPGNSGNVMVELGPGLHSLVAIATLTDGTKRSSRPSLVFVSGDLYAEAGRREAWGLFERARGGSDLALQWRLARTVAAGYPNGSPERTAAEAALPALTTSGTERIAAAIAARDARLGRTLATDWEGHPERAKLDTLLAELAASALTALGDKATPSQLATFITAWPDTPAAVTADTRYEQRMASDLDALLARPAAPSLRLSALARFVKEAPRDGAATARARSERDALLATELATAKAQTSDRGRQQALSRLAKQWPDTDAGREAAKLAGELEQKLRPKAK